MIIQFGILNYKHLMILLLPFFREIPNYILFNKYRQYYNPFFSAFNDFLGLTFCGAIYLIFKYLIKTEEQKEEKKEEKKKQKKTELDNLENYKKSLTIKEEIIQSIHNSQKKNLEKINKNKYKYILVISALQMCAVLIRNIFREKINKELLLNINVLMQILFLTVFSIIFLSFSLYLHQYFSIILIILCTSIFLIESIIYSKEIHFINILISFLYSFSYEMLYCLSDVL